MTQSKRVRELVSDRQPAANEIVKLDGAEVGKTLHISGTDFSARLMVLVKDKNLGNGDFAAAVDSDFDEVTDSGVVEFTPTRKTFAIPSNAPYAIKFTAAGANVTMVISQ